MILKRQEKENITKAIYDSSNILASTYDSSNGDLTIIFKSGTQYKYPNVSKSDYMRFEVAESQGKVFNTHIKKYVFEKLENFDVSEISVEIETLANKEKEALYEAKKMELVNKMKYVCYIYDEISLGKNKTNEAQEVFIKSIEDTQTLINEFLEIKNKENE